MSGSASGPPEPFFRWTTDLPIHEPYGNDFKLFGYHCHIVRKWGKTYWYIPLPTGQSQPPLRLAKVRPPGSVMPEIARWFRRSSPQSITGVRLSTTYGARLLLESGNALKFLTNQPLSPSSHRPTTDTVDFEFKFFNRWWLPVVINPPGVRPFLHIQLTTKQGLFPPH